MMTDHGPFELNEDWNFQIDEIGDERIDSQNNRFHIDHKVQQLQLLYSTRTAYGTICDMNDLMAKNLANKFS